MNLDLDGSYRNRYYVADGIKASSVAKVGFKVISGLVKIVFSSLNGDVGDFGGDFEGMEMMAM